MSSKDQMHSARIHGEALVEARKMASTPEMAAARGRRARAADSPAERAEIAGTLAGEAIATLRQLGPDADPDTVQQAAEKMLAAALAAGSGVLDYSRLSQSVRKVYESARGDR